MGDNGRIQFHKRTTTITVAASDAISKAKGNADYICNGRDDQLQVQEAIDFLPAYGGVIELTAGTFVFSAPITVPDYVTIQGQGAATTLGVNNWNPSFSPDVHLIENSGTTDIVLRDFKIDGSEDELWTGDTHEGCIHIDGCNYLTIDNIIVDSGASQGVIITESNYFSVQNSTFTNCFYDGIEVFNGCVVGLIYNCIFINNGQSGTESPDNGNLKIRNDCEDIVIDKCTLETEYGYNLMLYMSNGFVTGEMKRITVKNCRILTTAQASTASAVIYLRGIYGPDSGSSAYDDKGWLENITFKNNYIETTVASVEVITFRGVKWLTIDNNIIKATSGSAFLGVNAFWYRNVYIINNYVETTTAANLFTFFEDAWDWKINNNEFTFAGQFLMSNDNGSTVDTMEFRRNKCTHSGGVGNIVFRFYGTGSSYNDIVIEDNEFIGFGNIFRLYAKVFTDCRFVNNKIDNLNDLCWNQSSLAELKDRYVLPSGWVEGRYSQAVNMTNNTGNSLIKPLSGQNPSVSDLTGNYGTQPIHVDCLLDNVWIDLPPALPGMEFTFVVIDATYEMVLNPDGLEIIRLADHTISDSKRISNSNRKAVGDSLRIKCLIGGEWEHFDSVGTWT